MRRIAHLFIGRALFIQVCPGLFLSGNKHRSFKILKAMSSFPREICSKFTCSKSYERHLKGLGFFCLDVLSDFRGAIGKDTFRGAKNDVSAEITLQFLCSNGNRSNCKTEGLRAQVLKDRRRLRPTLLLQRNVRLLLARRVSPLP